MKVVIELEAKDKDDAKLKFAYGNELFHAMLNVWQNDMRSLGETNHKVSVKITKK